MTDNINPQHYRNGDIECIDAIKAALTPEEFRGYCKGNAIKYVWRERMKGGNESLQKANWYMDKAVSVSAAPSTPSSHQALTFQQWWDAGGHKIAGAAASFLGWRGAAEAGYIGGLISGGITKEPA